MHNQIKHRSPSSSRSYFFVFIAAAVCQHCIALQSVKAQLPTASLRTIWPQAVQAGTTNRVVVEGDFLDEAEQLIFSDPRVKAQVVTSDPLPGEAEPAKQYGQFTVDVPAEVAGETLDIRVRGRYGLSNPRRFSVQQSPVNTIEAPRFAAEQAQEISVGNLLLARATANQVDHYKIALEANHVVEIKCDALNVDSLLWSNLVLFDSEQKEVTRSRSTKAADAVLSYQVPAAGVYYLNVHDVLFRGGSQYFYQLKITSNAPDSTAIASAERLADQTGTREQILTSVGNARKLQAADLINNSIVISPPEKIVTSFPSTGVPAASFDFEAKAGQRLMIEVRSAIAGAATDPEMQIGRLRQQGDGSYNFERLHHIDDVSLLPGSLLGSTNKDPAHLFHVPEDGRYRIILRDLQTTSDDSWNRNYELSVRPSDPNFQLLTYVPHPTLDPARSSPMGTMVRRGDKLAVEVAILPEEGFFGPVIAETTLARGELRLKQTINWVWPVVVTAEGLPAGMTASTLKLDNINRRGYLILEASDDAADWAGQIDVVGKVELPAELGGQTIVRKAEPITIQHADPDGRGHAIVRSCSALQIAITDQETTPLKITLGGEASEFTVKVGAELEIPLSIIRSENAKGKVTIRATNLPPNAGAGEINLEGETLATNLKLTVPANVPLGDYQIFVNGETELPWSRNPQALSRAEQRLAVLKQRLVDADESQKEVLAKQVMDAEMQVNQLREATKPQNARAFVPSNVVTVHVVAAQ